MYMYISLMFIKDMGPNQMNKKEMHSIGWVGLGWDKSNLQVTIK